MNDVMEMGKATPKEIHNSYGWEQLVLIRHSAPIIKSLPKDIFEQQISFDSSSISNQKIPLYLMIYDHSIIILRQFFNQLLRYDDSILCIQFIIIQHLYILLLKFYITKSSFLQQNISELNNYFVNDSFKQTYVLLSLSFST